MSVTLALFEAQLYMIWARGALSLPNESAKQVASHLALAKEGRKPFLSFNNPEQRGYGEWKEEGR